MISILMFIIFIVNIILLRLALIKGYYKVSAIEVYCFIFISLIPLLNIVALILNIFAIAYYHDIFSLKIIKKILFIKDDISIGEDDEDHYGR